MRQIGLFDKRVFLAHRNHRVDMLSRRSGAVRGTLAGL
jgi:hypothetical protein